MKIQVTTFIASSLLVTTVLASLSFFANTATAETLQGGVKEKGTDSRGDSRLKRNDTNQGLDPFSSPGQKQEGGSAQSPPGAQENNDTFAVTPKPFMMDPESQGRETGSNRHAATPHAGRLAPPKNRNIDDTKSQGSKAAPQNGSKSAAPSVSKVVAPFSGRSATPTIDPEKSPEMQLLWDAWHKSVAQTIYTRFNRLARAKFKKGAPLVCKVSYVVLRDGSVDNVRVLQASADPAFDELVETVVKSMAHSGPVQFPRHSQRQSIERSGTFTFNETENKGFDYQKGDKEQIKN